MQIKALFLDFNGVIFDDRHLTYASNKYTFESFNMAVIPTLEEWRAGMGLDFMEFYKRSGITNVSRQKLNSIRRKYIFNHWNEADVRPYCYNFLTEIRKSGLKTAIVSAENNALLVRRINEAGLAGLFDKIYTDSYPKVDYLRKALKFFELKPDEVIFVEDTAEGVRAGNEAGLITVGFLNETSYNHHERILEARPRFTVKELPELVEVIGMINLAKQLESLGSGLIIVRGKQ